MTVLQSKVMRMVRDVFRRVCRRSLSDINAYQRLEARSVAPSLLLDIIRMIANRAETVTMPVVLSAQSKKRNARKLPSQLLECKANLIP